MSKPSMVTRDDLEYARRMTEAEISRCWELAGSPGADREYWLRRMDDRLDIWIMGRDQLNALSQMEDIRVAGI